MKIFYARIFVIFLLLIIYKTGFSTPSASGNFDTIKSAVEGKRYQKALDELLVLEKQKPDNSQIQYLIGFCSYNLKQENAVSYLEKASQKVSKDYKFLETESNAPVVAIYFLAKAYQSSMQFEKAIESFNKYKSLLTSKDKITPQEIEQNIEMCNSALSLTKNPLSNVELKNITSDKGLNFQEVLLYLSPDKQWFLYSTTLSNYQYSDNTGISSDFFVCKKSGDQWSSPDKVSASLSAADLSQSENSTPFYFSRSEKKAINLYHSFCLDGKITNPIKLDLPVNNDKSSQLGACTTEDGTTLFFSSNREGGYGGYDIYKCTKMSTGKWGTPQNLGPQVNTSSDETCPFVLSDGVTLYFSSKGHNSIGGYDIFVSTQSEEGFWSKAENVGYPINSPDDDFSYFLSSDEKNAFFSSSRMGTKGGGDLFQVDFK